jgi:hypothetical protein
MNTFFTTVTSVFNPLQNFYERESVRRKISVILVIFFLCSLVVIEINRHGLLPSPWGEISPRNHFFAVQGAFAVILILEIISLIFILPFSFSRSLGKQFEILSLILIRNAFKELSLFPEPIVYAGNEEAILHILASGFGALVIFALLGFYYKIQRQSDDEKRFSRLDDFVAAKKAVSLVLLIFFMIMGGRSAVLTILGIEHTDFFHDFYTVLILTDILIIFISQCFYHSPKMIFRNSGYALSTLMVRIALVAPIYINVLLGSAAVTFAILLVFISQNLFRKEGE